MICRPIVKKFTTAVQCRGNVSGATDKGRFFRFFCGIVAVATIAAFTAIGEDRGTKAVSNPSYDTART
jgi:hypothetical protein